MSQPPPLRSSIEDAEMLLQSGESRDGDVCTLLTSIGFSDPQAARVRFLDISADDECRRSLGKCLPMLLTALSGAANPDGSLINFERYAQSVDNPARLFDYLASNPRAVEILVKLFVGSQFLTEILLRNPDYLQRLTDHKRLADFKSRQQFFEEARQASAGIMHIDDRIDALRRYQHWELLRIGACDSFRLFDLKSVTVQLSLLADSLVQSCLNLFADELKISLDGFAVLAFGKLGGEELNYSSDIDLVFLAESDSARFWPLGQRLIKALMQSSGEGFLYRVDMRLRPWGRSGALVNTVGAHIEYLKQHGLLWEKQALIKARVIAGDLSVGRDFLQRAELLIYDTPADVVRKSIREMKIGIEAELEKQGRTWGEVKSGEGSIRDVEFVTQGLQLIHGGKQPAVRSFNTLDGLIRLADFGILHADQFRQLSSGYVFLRTIEHSLQLMHHKQTHSLPDDVRELAFLARRLDYPSAEHFLTHYKRHCETIRAIFDRHIGEQSDTVETVSRTIRTGGPVHLSQMEPSYSATFTELQIAHHAALLDKLSDENLVEIEAEPVGEDQLQVTIVGFDHRGDLSRICGLLFVYGFNIIDGNVFTAAQMAAHGGTGGDAEVNREATSKFVNVFTVRPPLDVVLPDVWPRYKEDLEALLRLVRAGKRRDAQGQLAKRVAGALRDVPDDRTTLLPVDIQIDNQSSQRFTVLQIRADDTIGFLYEFSNALALAGINVNRVIVGSQGHTVFDTLFVTGEDGQKITDENRQRELRASVVLIKHFTHLLPRSPNPEAALLHFSDFLEQMFQHPAWVEELASLENSKVLDALARLLGVSDFLWEDFLRLQHENLFPVVRDIEALSIAKSAETLHAELQAELNACSNSTERRKCLNAFKDRAMFRVDMRHIVGDITEFGQFSSELTDVAEVVVAGACRICLESLTERFGAPLLDDGSPCPLSVCALGKCGGRELGFASDIELMFIFLDDGKTSGPDVITTGEFYQKLVEAFRKTIEARREGIFQIDLRLRPYGRAGTLAVTFDAFRNYFGPEGAAWPYERQALVKLRPIFGDVEFGSQIVELRDTLIYSGAPFDVAAMRAMREKQVVQLVEAGTLNAKLSPGGLVDTEYIVQGLQISFGHRSPSMRSTNTVLALDALKRADIMSADEHRQLLDAYVFQRRLIDALRMVRGHAKDLTVPPPETEEFEFLARRLGYGNHLVRLTEDLERYSRSVQELTSLLEKPARDVKDEED